MTDHLWVAFVFFTDPLACDRFNEMHKLQNIYEPQCVIVEAGEIVGYAPETSPRPQPRPKGETP